MFVSVQCRVCISSVPCVFVPAQCRSNDESVHAVAMDAVRYLATQCSDSAAIESLAKHFFAVINGLLASLCMSSAASLLSLLLSTYLSSKTLEVEDTSLVSSLPVTHETRSYVPRLLSEQ